MGEGESDETSSIFCGHVNFPEINRGISVYGGTSLSDKCKGKKSNNQKQGGLVITNNTLQK